MSVEENKAVANRWIEMLNDRRFEAIDEVLAKNYVLHNASDSSWSPSVQGLEAAKEAFPKWFSAAPNLQLSVHDIVGEGDKVSVRGTWLVEGKPVAHHMVFFRFSDGKIVDDWPCRVEIGTDTGDPS